MTTTTTTTTTKHNVVLALDVGSSSVRCSAYRVVDPDDRLVPLERARASQPTAGVCAATGAVPVAGVLEAVDQCVDQVLRELRDDDDDDGAKGDTARPTIVAVGFSTFSMNLVGLNDDDDDDDDDRRTTTTTTTTLSYACRRHRDKAEAIERALGGPEGAAAAYRRTGAPVRPAYAAPQLAALHDDDATTRVSRWTTLSALCLSRWTGVAPTRVSYSEAAWTGLLNASTATWDEELLSVLPPGLPLPEPVDPLDHVVTVDHTVDTPYVARWPELFVPRRTAFLLGDGDGACANVGSKCTSSSAKSGGAPHRVAVTIGTSAAVRVLVHRPLGSSVDVPPGLFAYRVDANSILVGGALTDGGSVVEWTRGLVLDPTKGENEEEEEWERLVTEATTAYDAADASSHRPLVMIPFLSGERSTEFRADATGAICGLTRRTTKADLLRAGLEGVVLRLRRVLSLMTPLLSRSTNDDDDNVADFVLVASGAGLQKSPLWRRMIADAAGVPVVVDAEAAREGTSRGAARTAATAARRRREPYNENNVTREEELVEEDRVVPDPHKRAYWNALEAAQEEFIEAVSVMW